MASLRGDFEKLYQAQVAYVVRTLRRLGVRPADLEDLAHDVFVVAYRRREDRDQSRPVRPWLFGIAYRVVGNHRQKAHQRHEVPAEDATAPDECPSPEEVAEKDEQRRLLFDA